MRRAPPIEVCRAPGARIENNRLLFGTQPDARYPACTVPAESSDRFLLYTDGVTEPENAAGEAFGDRQLERIGYRNRTRPASELSREVESELRSGKVKPRASRTTSH